MFYLSTVLPIHIYVTGFTGLGSHLIPSPFWGWSPPQDADPLAPGWTVAQAPAGVRLETFAAQGQLVATIRGRPLVAGEVVGFDWTGRADRFAERAAAFWVAVDADGDGIRATLPGPVELEVTAGVPAGIVATLPSAVAPGAAVVLRLAVVDAVGNAFRPVDGPIRIVAPEGIEHPETVTPDGRGLAVASIVPRRAGVVVVAVEGPGGLRGTSNPMVVREGAVPIRWADLQIHTALSDGSGAPEDVLRYAREVVPPLRRRAQAARSRDRVPGDHAYPRRAREERARAAEHHRALNPRTPPPPGCTGARERTISAEHPPAPPCSGAPGALTIPGSPPES